MRRHAAGELLAFATALLARAGLPDERAQAVAEVLLEGDLLGHTTHGLDLLPTRYDRVAEGFGAHGEYVERPAELAPALQRAAGAGRAACVNVMIERLPAPTFRRGRIPD